MISRILIAVQIVAIAIGVVASFGEIETILFSGPTVGLLGIVIAFLSFRRNDGAGLIFGLSATSITVLCFSIIFGLGWSPGDAEYPIPRLLTVFAAVSIPTGVVAFARASRPVGKRRRVRMQFQISSLLGLMFFVALVLGLRGLLAAHQRDPIPSWVAAGIVIVYSTIIAIVIKRFREGLPDTGPREGRFGGDSPFRET